MRKLISLAIAASALSLFPLAGQAQMIGVHFSAGDTSPLPSATKAGFVPQANWNNEATASGTNVSPIVDNTGAEVSGLSISWGATNDGAHTIYAAGGETFGVSDPNQAGDTGLFSQGINVSGSPGDQFLVFISVNGIPYSTYDVYVYFGGAAYSDGTVNINGKPVFSGTTAAFSGGLTQNYSSANPNYGFVAADSTGDAANYAVFKGVSGSTLNVYNDQEGGGVTVGIQIVNAGTPVAPAISAKPAISATSAASDAPAITTATTSQASQN